jgi:negative regulator of sigma E activity
VSKDIDLNMESNERMEEGASQLSAMFDGELSAAECELLSRRLGRDEVLRTRWARYALVGAAMRAEPVGVLRGGFAGRVGASIDREHAAVSSVQAVAGGSRGFRRLRTAALGGTLVAGVAALAVFALRSEMLSSDQSLAEFTPTAQPSALFGMTSNPASNRLLGQESGEPVSYIVPPSGSGSGKAVPAALANYVVAHSEYSSPLARRGLLSALMASDAGEVSDPDAAPDVVIVDEGGSEAP